METSARTVESRGVKARKQLDADRDDEQRHEAQRLHLAVDLHQRGRSDRQRQTEGEADDEVQAERKTEDERQREAGADQERVRVGRAPVPGS